MYRPCTRDSKAAMQGFIAQNKSVTIEICRCLPWSTKVVVRATWRILHILMTFICVPRGPRIFFVVKCYFNRFFLSLLRPNVTVQFQLEWNCYFSSPITSADTQKFFFPLQYCNTFAFEKEKKELNIKGSLVFWDVSVLETQLLTSNLFPRVFGRY